MRQCVTRHKVVSLYIDGGGKHADEGMAPSWAVVVLLSFNGKCHFAGYLANLVHTCPNDPQFLGADSATSGSAELSAQLFAALWVIANPLGLPCNVDINVYYDSVVAAGLSMAWYSPRRHV